MDSRFSGPNLAQILANAETIKTAKLRRETAEKSAKRDDDVMTAREGAVSGQKGAWERLAVLDPAGAGTLKRTLDALSKPKGGGKPSGPSKSEIRDNAKRIGEAAAYVINADDPEYAYNRIKQSMPPELAAQMPTGYSQSWVEGQLIKAMGVEDYLAREDRNKRDAKKDAEKEAEDSASAFPSLGGEVDDDPLGIRGAMQ